MIDQWSILEWSSKNTYLKPTESAGVTAQVFKCI